VPGELNDFTPFGYLRNASHRALAWGDTEGGNLRTSPDRLGIEWAYPVGRDVSSRAGIVLEATLDGRVCRTRADFDAIGMVCRYHSCLIFGVEWQFDAVHVEAHYFLSNENSLCVRVSATNTGAESRRIALTVVRHAEGEPPSSHVLAGTTTLEGDLPPGEQRWLSAVLGRGADMESASARASESVVGTEVAYAELQAEDARFFATCPMLDGDWPAHWREGLYHDFQTTRLLVQPAGGIFQDVWPSWMAAWPRVVFAEGTLDMLRLSYADAVLAQRAILTLLRDAPEPNVPCVFRGGEYNMIAADGSRCGTSPAWCLPFLNLQLLYLRTLDRAWLAKVYPLAGAYVDWWLANRTDADGWIIYKCTWESGEDGNPRLDPTGSGDADISGRARPVELQATLAHAAGVLAFFAAELGLDADHWRHLESVYRDRTRQLYDPVEGRYRDWTSEESPDRLYWGIDPNRYSAQSLTPLLLGLPLDEAEVWSHVRPPWTLWPSWTWSLVESAAAAGLYIRIGELAFETIDRVYRATTRRELGSFARPLPGSSPEFWPEDWRTYGGSDAYGWGATTANLLIRHLFGFKESSDTAGWVAELMPAFPRPLLRMGARYAIRRMNYRGRTFDLSYTVLANGRLRAVLVAGEVRREFELANGVPYTLRLP
jgi:hypothetical protein